MGHPVRVWETPENAFSVKGFPQKKVLSLVLCLAVMLSVMVVGAGAAFSDQDKIENTEAVDACSALNIINGYEDGAFHPERNIKRAEVTKMICVALNGGEEPNTSTNAKPTFTDVRGTIYAWAEGYIESCYAQGIVDGVNGNRFAPASNVTAAQLAKMLLVSLGYNAKTEQFTGNAWETNVNVRAAQKHLYDGLEKMDTSAPVTRDQAAQMVWNAMQAYEVVYKDGVVQDKVVGQTDDKITLLRDRYNALISVGTLTEIDKTDLGIAMSPADMLASDDPDVKHFSKLDKDYSSLMGQKVKVIYNRDHSDQVLGVFSTSDNTVYSVIANETSKDDNKVKFGGKSYSVDGDLKTFINGKEDLTTSLEELDNNTLNPNAYTFVDSDANGRLDTLVVKTYDVAQVTYAASDKIIAGGQTYKYADENIADGIKKDDWVVITHNLYKDNLDIVKAEMQTGTLNGTRLDRDVTPYFDGADKLGGPDTYNEYQIGDTWFNGGEDLVQSKASENDLHVVRPGETVEYIAVNGVMFYVKKASGDAVGRVADVAMVIERDDTSVRDEVRIAFFDGTTKTVTVNDKSKVPFDGENKLTVGTVYEYDVTNGEYRFETLKDGVAEEKYENYYGDLTWRGKDKALAAKTFDNLVIDDNAQVLLYKDNKVKAISGKQFKAGNVFSRVVEDKAVYGFSGDMNGLDRIGALAVEVNNLENIVKTWSNYGYIVTQPIKTGNNKIEYTIWTKDGNITVQEDKNNITERDKGTVIGFDTLTELPSTPSGDNKVTHLIDDVEKLDADEITFTAVVDSNDKSVKFSATPVYADGAELDVAGTILYIDSDKEDMEIGVKDGSIKDAQKINGKWQANALVIGNNGDIELLIVDQGTYLKNDVYKGNIDGTNTVYGDGTVTPDPEPEQPEDPNTVPETEAGYTVNMVNTQLMVDKKSYNNGYVYFQLRDDQLPGVTKAIVDYTITDDKLGTEMGNADVIRGEDGKFNVVKVAYTPNVGAKVIRIQLSNPVANTYTLTTDENCLLDLGSVTTIGKGATEIKATVKFPAGVAAASNATIKVNGLSTGFSVKQDNNSFANSGSAALTNGKEVVITLTDGASKAIKLSTTATLSYKASIDTSAVEVDPNGNNIAVVTPTQPAAAIAATSATNLSDGSVAVKLLNMAAADDKLIVSYTVNGKAQADVEVTCTANQNQTIAGANLKWTGAAKDLTNVAADGVKIVITNIQFQKKTKIEVKNNSQEGLENVVSKVMINTTKTGAEITKDGTDLNLVAGKEYTLTVTTGSNVGSADVNVVLKSGSSEIQLGTIKANTADQTELTFKFVAPADLSATGVTIEKKV